MLDPDLLDLPPRGRPIPEYIRFLLRLRDMGHLFDRKAGRVYWMEGRVLTMLREQCRKPGDWARAIKMLAIKPTKAKYLRKIARCISEDQSRTLGFSEMLARVYPSFRQAVSAEVQEEEQQDRATGDSKGKGRSKSKSSGKVSVPAHKDSRGNKGKGGPEQSNKMAVSVATIQQRVVRFREDAGKWADPEQTVITYGKDRGDISNAAVKVEGARDNLSRLLSRLRGMLTPARRGKRRVAA